jgi:uroporphyrinogen decarboxylase
MSAYLPDYTRIVRAARNKETDFIPIYEHAVSWEVQSALVGEDLAPLVQGTHADKRYAFSRSVSLFASLGYDVYPFEGRFTELVQAGQALMGRAGPIITSNDDLVRYPWGELADRYFDRFNPYFQALVESLPPGMKAIAGVGNGPFEIAQDFVPLTDLVYLEVDDPQTFGLLWQRIGNVMYAVWQRFLELYGEHWCVCRIGDDFGFKTSLLMRPDTYRDHILPVYRRLIELVHSYDKPFLLHSCGAIWELMDDLIACGIDAKHSNEDSIAPFDRWLELFGDRIGNFGGVDMNVLCTEEEAGIRAYVRDVYEKVAGRRGVALGSGNQIADYVPPEGFLAMVETVRSLRGE